MVGTLSAGNTTGISGRLATTGTGIEWDYENQTTGARSNNWCWSNWELVAQHSMGQMVLQFLLTLLLLHL